MHNNTNIYGEESISSDNFKFVEETQSNTLQGTAVEFQSSKEDTIAKIQNKNEVFLKNSWANMEDVNENEATSEEDILGRDDLNFQLVVSRSYQKKKRQVKKTREDHFTRTKASKVSLLNEVLILEY